MDPVRRKALGRSLPKRGKTNRIRRTDALLKRQRRSSSQLRSYVYDKHMILLPGDKTWLETHIWHAKRMKMENMWGYRLVGPVTHVSRILRPKVFHWISGNPSYREIFSSVSSSFSARIYLARCVILLADRVEGLRECSQKSIRNML
jgi:hypothetical protein